MASVKKRKRFRDKDKSKERGRMFRTRSLHWCHLMTVMLLDMPGAASLTLEGQKGHNITLPCSCTTENVSVRLTFGPLTAYGALPSEEYKGWVIRTGPCYLMLSDLKTTDAGKYMLHMYGNCDPKSLRYYIHVSGCKVWSRRTWMASVKKRKRFRDKDKSKERGRMFRTRSLHWCHLMTVMLLDMPDSDSMEGRHAGKK